MLRFSRFCARFLPVRDPLEATDEASHDAWVRTIEEHVARFKIGLLIPADAKATLLLVQLRGRLSAPTFPAPTPASFQLLNDKWAFYKLCLELGLRTPRTWMYPDKRSVLKAIGDGELPEHLIVKPPDMAGGFGVVPLDAANAVAELDAIDYQPILVQEFIPGHHIGLSVLTIQGKVVASVVHQILSQRFCFAPNEEYARFGAEVARHMGTDGVMNYDAQLTPDGVVYLLECNPRVYLSMDYAAIAGINFIAMGLRDWSGFSGDPLTVPQVNIPTPFRLVQTLFTPWRLSRVDLRAARFFLADPVSQFLEIFRLAVTRFPTTVGGLVSRVKPLQVWLDWTPHKQRV
jgi:predicted ATP-grasp superfamily ATP-dependent carboligase